MSGTQSLLELADTFAEKKEKGNPFSRQTSRVGRAVNNLDDPLVYAEVRDNILVDITIDPDAIREFADDLDALSVLVSYTVGLAYIASRSDSETVEV